jgi:hypothetical protein
MFSPVRLTLSIRRPQAEKADKPAIGRHRVFRTMLLDSLHVRYYSRGVKAIALNEAQSRLDELFENAQAGSPVLLVRGGEVAKLERVAPPEFGGDLATLERMLVDAVPGPHPEWTPQDLEDIARRVRQKQDE